MLSYTGLHLARLLLSWTEPALSYQNGGIILRKWPSCLKRHQTLPLCTRFFGLSGT